MEEINARFKARSDNGTEYDVIEVQEYVDASDHDGPKRIRGMKRVQLADTGECINRIDERTFKIVTTGEIIRRID